jgi:integrase
MPSYKQLARDNWKVQISLGYKDGKKQIIRKQGFKTKKAAESYANEILNQKNKGFTAPTSQNNVLFKDYIFKWFNEYKSITLSINTKNDYNYRINAHIIPLIGDYKLKDITTSIIQDFYNKLISEKGMKPVSAKKVFDIANGCLKYAKKSKLIFELPTDIEKQKLDKPTIVYWSQDEVDFYLNAIKDDYLFTPVFIDILTGLRIAELCGLRWKDVDLDNGFIEVNSQVIQDKMNKQVILTDILKTSTSHRIIYIPDILVNFLNDLKERNDYTENDFVVQSRTGGMCTPRNVSMNFTKSIRKYKKSIEEIKKATDEEPTDYMQLKQITFHGLRHTHATLLILNGDNIKVVSDRLGHRDINITLNTYTHVMDNMKINTANLLDNMFKSSTLFSTQNIINVK